MQPLGGELLLAAWEQGALADEHRRPLTLLALALPARERCELEAVSLAERTLLLLTLHELSFGPLLGVFGTCARCAAPFEFSVRVAELIAGQQERLPGEPLSWVEDEREYRLRPVTTADLLAVLEPAEPAQAEDRLLARCLESAAGNREPSPLARERFEQLNAGAELSLTIACPACSALDTLDLDIARFLWTEVRQGASRLLGEIHTLAGAYGWSEQAIVQMSAGRRAAYLELMAG
jgi:hypothetical protein